MTQTSLPKAAPILIALALATSSLACQAATRLLFPPTVTATLAPSATAAPTETRTPAPTTTQAPSVTPTIGPTPLSLRMRRQVFDEAWNIVNKQYLYPDFNGLDWDKLRDEYGELIESAQTNDDFYNLMWEMIARLDDEHSTFLSPDDAAAEDQEMRGELNYVGVGVIDIPVFEKKLVTIISVFEGGPADEAGLNIHDNILAVDGEPVITADGNLDTRLRGPEGSAVTVLAQTPGEAPRTVTITRRRIAGETPLYYRVYQTQAGKRIGYILLLGFSDETGVDKFRSALRAMVPLDGIIVDNRVNYGGSVGVMMDILSFFLKGNIGAIVERGERSDLYIDRLRNVNGSRQMPLVVFVGPESVSAGEVFSGVIQDQGRGHLIGETTLGNVEVLSGFDFADGSRLWLATAAFEPFNNPNADWERHGIVPDEVVVARWEEFTPANDPAVAAALAYFDRLK